MRQPAILTILALILSLGMSAESAGQQSRLDLYGFFDVEVTATNAQQDSAPWTFDQHHLNLVSIYRVESKASVYTEIEWEHGPSIQEANSEGRIYLVRAYLEYAHTDALRLRAGKFLTPFGLYNERHGATPTFITTKLPHALYSGHDHHGVTESHAFAQALVGLELVGTVMANRWEATYKAFIANGRGSTPSGQDSNINKAIGGRLTVSPPIGGWHVGMSIYRDRNGNAGNQKQQALAFENEWDYGLLHVEGEVIFPRSEMAEGMSAMAGKTHKALGYYGLAAVTLRDRVTLFGRYSSYDANTGAEHDIAAILTMGVNYTFSPRIILKNEVHLHRFEDPEAENFEMFVASVAVAF